MRYHKFIERVQELFEQSGREFKPKIVNKFLLRLLLLFCTFSMGLLLFAFNIAGWSMSLLILLIIIILFFALLPYVAESIETFDKVNKITKFWWIGILFIIGVVILLLLF